ncbi:histone deacetylase family protein [Rhodoferax mekongensis]|jgi:acetoin utilization deacetylase AcuC-like enzyme|uniref:Histone deacetylase family protein n=1 Tax=Rhodoferax mekongensis TaxID=3068341 RepID=A0ABZ0B3E4_9BURK|nr:MULTISPECIES: histone deacetylase family protein [unclassified Rhodoferax]MDT7516272.1 histone deacetylase family protein [Rhodoferax sp. TBRC 17199]WNO06426.1 histone deacetylase family protein [Rhodoferax sp. TBRC 17307]
MLPAFISHPDCARHEMGPDHPECPERLGAIQDMLLLRGLLDYMNTYDAPLATEAQLGRAHAINYVHELMEASPKEGYHKVDPDTDMNPFTVRAALRAAGAAVQATDLVISGQVPTAFCSVRPPGHHAERSAAMGFCFFNNVAVGIRHALDVHGLERVALIDFDVHHGNGSEDIFRGDERVLMCSIFEQGLYPYNGEKAVGPNMMNVGLPARSGSDKFREAVATQWVPALDAFAPQLIYISAGFDAHREDDMGNLGLVDADYAWVTRQLMAVAQRHCQGRIISCLEGGYVLNPLARSVAEHVKVLIGAD